MYRVLLVDDDPALRMLTRRILERSGRFQIVGEADDGDVAIRESETLRPDVVLLDLSMPRMNGLDALPEIRRLVPAARVVIFSMLHADRFERVALARGATAFIDKGAPSDRLVPRLLEALQGQASPGASVGRPG